MDTQKLGSLPPPPGVIGALRAGFEVVSTHVVLILVPLILDLLLWLGPRLSVDTLLAPAYRTVFRQLRASLASGEDAQGFAQMQSVFMDALERFNLMSLVSRLQAFPIGISSLMARTMPGDSPMGEHNVIPVTSTWWLLAGIFVLIGAGWVAGGLYFRWVSGTVLGQEQAPIHPLWAVFQTLLLSVIWTVGLIAVSIPLLMLLFALSFVSPVLASGAVFLILVLSFWLIVPLYFTPHGIFLRRQNAFSSIGSSLRMARFTLPTSGMFVFSVFLLSTGLNYLWRVPSSDSWMLLFGVFGHAFITTALLAASFVYYRDMNAWLQLVLENLKQQNQSPARQV